MARISHAGAALSLAISLLLFALVSHAAVIAGHANVPAKRHTVPAQLNIANATEHELTKRYTVNKSKWTYYETGKGACGGTNKDSDWIVAIDSGRFDSGNWCWKTIELFYNGKSAKAQVVDSCPGCGDGNLDLSPGLFQHFDSLDKGVLYGAYNA